MKKRILYILLTILLVAQFFRPDRSTPAIHPATDMLVMTEAPDEIRTLVQGACYDCHSYNTTYPWYSHVTPMNFWLQDHINEGREKMNFSRWNDPKSREEVSECAEVLTEGEMPPRNYAIIHGHAQLTAPQRTRLTTWFAAMMPKEENGSDAPHDD